MGICKLSLSRKKNSINGKKIKSCKNEESIDGKKKSITVEGKQFSRISLKRDIAREGRSLGKPSGAVEAIAEKVSLEVEKWVLERPEVTRADLNRVTAARIRKYDTDIAYIYRNRGKIM